MIVKKYPSLALRSLIGADVFVVFSKNKNIEKVAGKILFESRNTLLVMTQKGIKIIPKKGSIFLIQKNSRRYVIVGEFLVSKFARLRKIHRK